LGTVQSQYPVLVNWTTVWEPTTEVVGEHAGAVATSVNEDVVTAALFASVTVAVTE
jgi:hypothetical protein